MSISTRPHTACELYLSLALLLAGRAHAQIQLDLPAQPLDQSITAVGTLAHLNVLFDPTIVDGLRAPALRAELSADDALGRLLSGTPLHAIRVDANTIRVFSDSTTIRAQSTTFIDTGTSYRPGTERVAYVDQRAPAGDDSVSTNDPGVNAASANGPDRKSRATIGLDEVVVVGSRLQTSAGDEVQPIRILNRQVIEDSGKQTLSDLLNDIPEVSGVAAQSETGSTTIQLHGLPLGSTLVMINGRRIQSTSGQQANSASFFDLESIPLAAVERVEVLTAGSSAVYGGDALAGAVNIVLKNNYRGVEADVGYGAASPNSERSASLAWGASSARASLSIVGNYEKRTALVADDRPETASHTTAFQFSNPANIYSIDGGNLPGMTANEASVPTGSSGVGLTPADFAQTAGIVNTTRLYSQSTLIEPEERYGAVAYGSFKLGESVEAFTELMYSKAQKDYAYFPPIAFATVPATNPFNPFGEDVQVAYLFKSLGSAGYDTDERLYRGLVGLRGDLAGTGWHWEMAGWTSSDIEKEVATKTVNQAALTSSLASTDPTQALNVFQDGPGGSSALLNSIITNDVDLNAHSTFESFNLFAHGPVFALPSGGVEAVIGAEYDRDAVNYSSSDTQLAASRSAQAAFAEFRVPLIGDSARAAHSRDILVATAALRYDHYNDFGGRTTPQVGLRLSPIDSLRVTGSYSRSFRPPSLFQLRAPQVSTSSILIDPSRGGATEAVQVITGGNTALEPQRGSSRVFGLTYEPTFATDVRLSLSQFQITLDRFVTTPNGDFLLANESEFPGRVVRNAPSAADSAAGQPGPVSSIDTTDINFGHLEVAGIDYGVTANRKMSIGTLNAQISATQTYKYTGTNTPGAPASTHLGAADPSQIFAPRWKGSASLGWDRKPFHTALTGRYVSRYTDYDGIGTLGNVWYVDTAATVDLGSALSLAQLDSHELSATIGAVNLFNRLPDLSSYYRGYDPVEYDIRGRYVYAKVKLRW